ncbi:hypothetical protein Syun_007125 [Stephania yunnanensis]|uniref:Uncharacterized protein n=1 Tax=Stephania yunnanensis TaxID=152371 RepID=A0AAP0L1E7_9MAGN
MVSNAEMNNGDQRRGCTGNGGRGPSQERTRRPAANTVISNKYGDQPARGDGCRASGEEQRLAASTIQAAEVEGPANDEGFQRSDEQLRPAAAAAQAAVAKGNVDGDGFRGSSNSRRRLRRRRGQTAPPPTDATKTLSDGRWCSDLWVSERDFSSGGKGRRKLTVGRF